MAVEAGAGTVLDESDLTTNPKSRHVVDFGIRHLTPRVPREKARGLEEGFYGVDLRVETPRRLTNTVSCTPAVRLPDSFVMAAS